MLGSLHERLNTQPKLTAVTYKVKLVRLNYELFLLHHMYRVLDSRPRRLTRDDAIERRFHAVKNETLRFYGSLHPRHAASSDWTGWTMPDHKKIIGPYLQVTVRRRTTNPTT
jgi:hypothetical protein